MAEKVALIIPAAGIGARFNGGKGMKKPYLPLGGRPIIFRTLDRFLKIPEIVQRILVVHPDDVDSLKTTFAKELAETVVTDIVPGGATRQESVAQGLAALRDEVSIVAIHDSVRPFVSARTVELSIRRAAEVGGAVVAGRMVATVKAVDDDGKIIKTIPRRNLWMAQTPQTFRRAIIEKAFAAAQADGFDATDDASLVERIGQTVVIVESGPANLKITTPEDLEMAEAML